MNCWGSKLVLHTACRALCICESNSVQGIKKAFTATCKKKASALFGPRICTSLACLVPSTELEVHLVFSAALVQFASDWHSPHISGLAFVAQIFLLNLWGAVGSTLRCATGKSGRAVQQNKVMRSLALTFKSLLWLGWIKHFCNVRPHLWLQRAEIL